MARTVDYSKKAEKIKEQVDELVQELMARKPPLNVLKDYFMLHVPEQRAH